MSQDPSVLLFGLFIAIYLGAQSWRRRKLRRAVRDLPTRMQRLLGPEPDYLPPPDERLPDELRDFAGLHRRSGIVMKGFWALAFLWLAFVIYLVLRKQFA